MAVPLVTIPGDSTSRSNTRHRRAQWKAVPTDLVPLRVGGAVRLVPRRLQKAYARGLLDLP